MKLLINGWFWGQTTTGSGQYLHGLLRHLPAALPGWEITLLLPQQAGRPQGYAPTHAFPAPAGARMMRASLPPYARGARLVKLAWEQRVFPAWCKRLDADVALAPYWGSPIRPPCPTLVTIHDLIPLLLDDYASKPTARAYTWLVGRSAQRADAVLTVSQSARDDIVQHLGIPAERVIVTYESLGAPHAPVTDADELERMRQRYNLPARYLFYLGGFDPRKNVPLLIRAYGRARTMRPDLAPLLVAGKLPGPEEAWFTDPRPLIAELGWGITSAPWVLCPTRTSPPSTPWPTSFSSPPATKVSACRRWKRWPAGPPPSSATAAACPKWWATRFRQCLFLMRAPWPWPSSTHSTIPPTPPSCSIRLRVSVGKKPRRRLRHRYGMCYNERIKD